MRTRSRARWARTCARTSTTPLVSRRVATIRTDAPIELDLSDARFPTFDPAEVARAFSALGFTGMTSRLVRLAGEDAVAAARAALGEKNDDVAPTLELPAPLTGEEAAAALEDAVARGAWVGVAMDDDRAEGALFGLSHVLWAATGEKICRIEGDAADDALARLFREGRLAAGDVKALLHVLSPADSSVPEALSPARGGPGARLRRGRCRLPARLRARRLRGAGAWRGLPRRRASRAHRGATRRGARRRDLPALGRGPARAPREGRLLRALRRHGDAAPARAGGDGAPGPGRRHGGPCRPVRRARHRDRRHGGEDPRRGRRGLQHRLPAAALPRAL